MVALYIPLSLIDGWMLSIFMFHHLSTANCRWWAMFVFVMMSLVQNMVSAVQRGVGGRVQIEQSAHCTLVKRRCVTLSDLIYIYIYICIYTPQSLPSPRSSLSPRPDSFSSGVDLLFHGARRDQSALQHYKCSE